MATACLIAFFLVGGWLVPIDPSFFHSSTSVLILPLTTDWSDPFLSGMIFPLSAESIGRVFHHSARCNRTEIRPIFIALFAMCLFDIRRAFRTHGGDHAPFVHWVRNGQQQLDAAASATNRPAQCAARARGDDPLKQFAPTLTLMPPNSHPSLLHCEGLAEIVGGKAPIDQFVEHRIHVVRAAVLIIQIVGVFPHVDGQQRLSALPKLSQNTSLQCEC